MPERKQKIAQSADEILRLLTIVIRDAYPNDPSTPGIITSILNSGHFYCSIIRFKAKFGKEKYVVVSNQSTTIFDTLKGLAQKFADYWDKENYNNYVRADEKSNKKQFPKPYSYNSFDDYSFEDSIY